jgi:hypothetical protein
MIDILGKRYVGNGLHSPDRSELRQDSNYGKSGR